MANTKPKSKLAKYSSLILSVLLFLIITASILGYNFYTSSKIANKTTAINIAARQGVIVQQLAKDVMNIDLLVGQSESTTSNTVALVGNETAGIQESIVLSDASLEAIAKLKKSRDLFESTLTAFEKGGTTTGLRNETVTLDKVANREGIISVQNTRELWEPYKRLIDGFISSSENNNFNTETVHFAVDYARIFNSYLFNEANDLTNSLEQESKQQTDLLKLVQTVGIALAFLLFFFIMFGALRQLLSADKETEEARRETSDILHTVNNGLFLLDKDLTIGSQHSRALEDILLTKEIGGKKLPDLLSGIVSKDNIDVTGEFIEQLYNPRVKEKLINDLNPLSKIQVMLDDAGNMVSKHLDFGFSRIYKDKDISHILVSVNDITNAVRLEEKLEQERKQNDEQIQMVTTILNSDIRIVRDFVRNSKKITGKINDILRDSKKGTHVLEDKLKHIFREAHSLKGESSALNLTSLTYLITDFEENIKLLQKKPDLSGDDFLALTVRLDEIISVLQTIGMLSQRLGVVQTQSLSNLSQPLSENNTPTDGLSLSHLAQPTSENLEPVDNLSFTQQSNTADVLDQLQQDSTTQPEHEQIQGSSNTVDPALAIAANTAQLDNHPASDYVASSKSQLANSHPLNHSSATTNNIGTSIDTTIDTTHADSTLSSNSAESLGLGQITDLDDSDSVNDLSYKHTYYKNFVQHLAERNQKIINLEIDGIEHLDESIEKHQTLKEIALQLIRNSVTHGIELPSERIINSKNEAGTIKLILQDDGDFLSLSVEDDGAGIDYDAIREKAVSSGKFSADEVATWDNRKLLSLIFSSGFSTSAHVTEDAGQGVGLDVVKSRMTEIGAKLKIDTQFRKMTRFTIKCAK